MPTKNNKQIRIDDYDTEVALTGRRTASDRPSGRNGNVPRPDGNGPARPSRNTANTTSARSGSKKHRRRGNSSFVAFFTDKRTHLAAGIISCLTAVLMVASSISFIMNGSADQSTIHNRSIGEIVAAGDSVETAGGIAGAKLAEFLLVDTLGTGSFVIAIYLFLLGLAMMRVKKCHLWSLSFKCLFTATALSVITGLLSYNTESLFHLGGNHGYHINRLLHVYSDALGAYCVSVALAGILIAIYLHPLARLVAAARNLRFNRRTAAANAAENAEAVDIDGFDTPEEDSAEETESVTESEEVKKAEVLSRPADPGTLKGFDIDAFADEETDNDAENEITSKPKTENITLPQEEKKQEATEPATNTTNTPAKEPELEIVVNNNPDENRAASPSGLPGESTISAGSHIGLDQPFDHRAELAGYRMPTPELLIDRPKDMIIDQEEQENNKQLIINALRSFKIEISHIKATIGPTVTLYEIVPAEGVRISRIKSLEDDLALNLAALGIRIIAPIPGQGTIGLEVPNKKPVTVSIRSVFESQAFANCRKMALPLALGATISNDTFIVDLAKMPHLLVAGATGMGKSVGLNCIIASLLYTKHPSELKFVLIDPKTVEFSLYKRIARHYLAQLPDDDQAIITDSAKVVNVLNSLCVEMDNRYKLLSEASVRSLDEYNRKFTQRRLNPEQGHRYMPYIVMIVDEFADLLMTAGKDITTPIARIAQKARAVGMHMIIATQRPSTDVISGMIKNNFPARIAFRVSQRVDSMTIIDRRGADRLIGRGDMLFSINGTMDRVQCAFIDTEEVEALVEHIDSQIGYPSPYFLPEPQTAEGGDGGPVSLSAGENEFNQIARFVATQNVASTSMLQRKFSIGFNKAGRIMDQLYDMGVVGAQEGVKPRPVLMTLDEVNRLLAER